VRGTITAASADATHRQLHDCKATIYSTDLVVNTAWCLNAGCLTAAKVWQIGKLLGESIGAPKAEVLLRSIIQTCMRSLWP
jgi:hypothetical protein